MYTFHDPVCGEITTTARPDGSITIAVERLETDDALVPVFTLTLGAEHFAAWITALLNARGRTCTLCDKCDQLQQLLDRTRADPALVHCIHRTGAVILIRDGRVLKAKFRAATSVGDFLHSIREVDCSDRTATAEAFTRFARELIDPWTL